YPNPFNPETTLRFELIEATKISVQIYDLLGNRITTLTNAAFQPGEHNLTWNGRDYQNRLVGTGIYFLQISDDRGFSRTEKVISLR
ncbi:MAG: T9SS type A sorting domain-containing protein, partial [Candidatus Marinimicrobia bacterium]|nr:T9SS type A sorting domain-containing protein [Candidatus Neomarinimicrobiota bacterium]